MYLSTRETGAEPPKHVAIIMDGNGRWAKKRSLPRALGHKAGLDAVRRVVRAAPKMGIEILTLYAFSSENWSRPPQEVSELMGLLRLFVRKDLAELHANGVHVRVIGRRDNLQPDIARLIDEAELRTAENSQMTLNIAFNYGGRDEIARAVDTIVAQRLAAALANGVASQGAVSVDELACALDTGGQPDPDLIIRTSGEKRLSNFLAWQSAYSEFVFQDCLWPDYDRVHLEAAIMEYHNRERRFGGIVDTPAKTDMAL